MPQAPLPPPSSRPPSPPPTCEDNQPTPASPASQRHPPTSPSPQVQNQQESSPGPHTPPRDASRDDHPYAQHHGETGTHVEPDLQSRATEQLPGEPPGEYGHDTNWINEIFVASGKCRTDCGTGRGLDCWYVTVGRAAKEMGHDPGKHEQLRQQVENYALESIIPRKPSGDAQGNKQQRVDAQAYTNCENAIKRVRNKDVAGCQEIGWTASVTGLTIFIYHPPYQVLGAAATGCEAPEAWSYILPQHQEHLALPADMEKLQGKYIFLYSDGDTHYQAYLGNSDKDRAPDWNHQEKPKAKKTHQIPGQPKITSMFEQSPKAGQPEQGCPLLLLVLAPTAIEHGPAARSKFGDTAKSVQLSQALQQSNQQPKDACLLASIQMHQTVTGQATRNDSSEESITDIFEKERHGKARLCAKWLLKTKCQHGHSLSKTFTLPLLNRNGLLECGVDQAQNQSLCFQGTAPCSMCKQSGTSDAHTSQKQEIRIQPAMQGTTRAATNPILLHKPGQCE